jgi:hypothetical protein
MILVRAAEGMKPLADSTDQGDTHLTSRQAAYREDLGWRFG